MRTIRDEVENFLAGPCRHRLPAAGIWKPGNRDGELRLKLPVEVEGEIGQFDLQLIVAPDSLNPGLRIVLLCGRAFWRLCLDEPEHPNSFNRPEDLPAIVPGPHCHTWADNRHFGNPTSLPKVLKNARNLPDAITDEDSAFRWFLGQVNILEPEWDMPEWPKKTRLL